MNRLSLLGNQFGPGMTAQKDTLSVADNRTGKTYELAITDGAINATDLAKMIRGSSNFGKILRLLSGMQSRAVTKMQ